MSICSSIKLKSVCEKNEEPKCIWGKTDKCRKKPNKYTRKTIKADNIIMKNGEFTLMVNKWLIVASNESLQLIENYGKNNKKIYTIPIQNKWSNFVIEKDDDGFEAYKLNNNQMYFRMTNTGSFELNYDGDYQIFYIKVPMNVFNGIKTILYKMGI